MNEFGDLFKERHEHPPKKERDHTIHLLEGAQPQNARPYRYPHLLYKRRLVLLKTFRFISQLLREFYLFSYYGHFGFFKTYKRIALVLHWNGMKVDVKQFMAECEIC